MLPGLPPLTLADHEFAWGDDRGPTTIKNTTNVPRDDADEWTLVATPNSEDLLWARRKDGRALVAEHGTRLAKCLDPKLAQLDLVAGKHQDSKSMTDRAWGKGCSFAIQEIREALKGATR